MKKKIYVFNNGGTRYWYHAVALAEDGHQLAEHICSDEGFMQHDMGFTSELKHECYDKHFGKGNWELIRVDDPQNHEGLQEAFRLYQKEEK